MILNQEFASFGGSRHYAYINGGEILSFKPLYNLFDVTWILNSYLCNVPAIILHHQNCMMKKGEIIMRLFLLKMREERI